MATPELPTHPPAAKPGYNPLYLQVKQQLIHRIDDGEWPPGGVLPSEHQLAGQMEVSQGTVRKALDALASENLLVRQQGRGTFVAEHNQHHTLFQFFMVTADDGARRFPNTTHTRLGQRRASRAERDLLELESGARVWRLRRYRALSDQVLIVEHIVLALAVFPDLKEHEPLPNNVYQLYERKFGVKVARAVEKLKAVKADKTHAAALGCREDDPVLQIERVAYGLTGKVVELRKTICLTQSVHYLSDLR